MHIGLYYKQLDGEVICASGNYTPGIAEGFNSSQQIATEDEVKAIFFMEVNYGKSRVSY